MEGTLQDVPFIRHIISTGVLSQHPMTLLDIGCSGGIDQVWRDFEPALVVHGVDPMPQEVARLRSRERNPNIHYHCAFLNLEPNHPFIQKRGNRSLYYNSPWDRLSTAWGARIQAANNPKPSNEEILQSNRWMDGDGIDKTPTLTPTQLLAQTGVTQFDFIKIDVDGPDFDILTGLENRLGLVLGAGLEVNFVGSDYETDNTFHNVDRFMRRQGFSLVGLTHRPYSHAAMPSQFQYKMVAQTSFGPPFQGDAIYMRDILQTDQSHLATVLSDAQLIKLACLYALCNLPDCAAEILVHFRHRLKTKVDIDHALDLLTPAMADGKLSYKEYIARFENDMEAWFYPPYQPKPVPQPIPEIPEPLAVPTEPVAVSLVPDPEPTVSIAPTAPEDAGHGGLVRKLRSLTTIDGLSRAASRGKRLLVGVGRRCIRIFDSGPRKSA